MKRRFTINVSKGYIITAILFLLGVLVLVLGLLSLLKGWNALSISELEEYQIKDGQYVRGVIREYAGYYEIQGNENSFCSSPYGAIGLGGGTFYCTYTIKIADGKYINIFVNDEDRGLIKELDSYIGGKGNSAYFEGRIVKAFGDELEDSWYQKLFGVESKEEIDELAITDYIICQDSLEVDTKKISIGFLLIVVSIAYFFFSGGVKGLLVYWDEEKENE